MSVVVSEKQGSIGYETHSVYGGERKGVPWTPGEGDRIKGFRNQEFELDHNRSGHPEQFCVYRPGVRSRRLCHPDPTLYP